MKNISPKIITLLLILITLIFIGSCNKRNNTKPEGIDNEAITNLNEVTINEDFDWNTSKNIEFTISGSKAQIITISSVDQEVRYHRAYYQGNGDYIITLNIPNTVKNIMVNNQTVSLNSDHITYNLDE